MNQPHRDLKTRGRFRFFPAVFVLIFALLILALPGRAGDLRIENIRFQVSESSWGDARVIFDLSWQNAWQNSLNHDAVWIFLKFPEGGGFQPASVAGNGHSAINLAANGSPGAKIDVAADGKGFFIYPAGPFRGDINWRVTVKLETADLNERLRRFQPEVFGIEMVQIPTGGFTLGDPDPKALEFGSFFRSDSRGEPNGLIRVNSEAEINVGPADGALYYQPGEYVGDRAGPVPASFPKGFAAFYIMKYELTQGQYATFLNNISEEATFDRVNFAGRSYYSNKGTIKLVNGRYVAEKPDRPMNFISWDDGLAFADWAALRPLTEMEFTKASRGPRQPKPREFPWGTSDSDRLARIVDTENDLIFISGWDEEKLSNETLPVFGASYYWVLDLSGSLWERVITIGSADGRAFTGSHGDGQLDSRGKATNEDWPHTYKNENGHGYRGGGFYFQNRPEHEFNPYSPIAYRRFGGWSGADPQMAYGFRCARTAE